MSYPSTPDALHTCVGIYWGRGSQEGGMRIGVTVLELSYPSTPEALQNPVTRELDKFNLSFGDE